MKRMMLIFATLLMWIGVNAQSMKMVVDSEGEVVGRLVKINATTYTVSTQEDTDVPKAGHRVVVYSAEKGQGIVYRNFDRKGNINVRKGPSTKTAVIAKIPDCEDLPDPYDCLGKVKGWYKIKIDGKIGYVRADLMSWDGICTFCSHRSGKVGDLVSIIADEDAVGIVDAGRAPALLAIGFRKKSYNPRSA